MRTEKDEYGLRTPETSVSGESASDNTVAEAFAREKEKFIREKVVKKKLPLKDRILRAVRLFLTAVLFGVVASLAFVLLKPVWEDCLPEAQSYLEEVFPAAQEYISRLFSSDEGEEGKVTLPKDDDPATTTQPEEETSPESESPEEETLPPSEEAAESETETEKETESADTEEEKISIPADEDEADEEESEDSEEESEALLEEMINQILSSRSISASDVTGVSMVMAQTLARLNCGIASLSAVGVSSDGASYEPVAGLIWNMTESSVYLLIDYTSVRGISDFEITFYNGNTVSGTLRGADEVTGIAVVCCDRSAAEAAGITEDQVISLGSSYQVQSGQLIYCVGSPYGQVFSVASGMVSYVSTSNPGIDTDLRLLYTSISISEGGSAFLINTSGALVGVITSNTRSMTSAGSSAAIAISDLKSVIERLANGEKVAYFGIEGIDVTEALAEEHDLLIGIYVSNTLTGAPAYNSGIQSGDIITAVNGKSVTTMRELQSALASCSPGDQIEVTVSRKGLTRYVVMTYTVTLGSR